MPPKSKSKPQTSARTSSPAGGLKKMYLLAYNAASAIFWGAVLLRVVKIGSAKGLESALAGGKVYEGTEEFARLVQSAAVLEVVHSLVGLVRAPLLTTLMQVASRLLLVWGIAYNFPQTTKYSPAYSTMLIAWSVTEVVRYSYFVFNLQGSGVPRILTWSRYNLFLILYPLGVASETWLIYKAIGPASKINENHAYGLCAILATYVPGFYMLFTHMLAQRRRIMRKSA